MRRFLWANFAGLIFAVAVLGIIAVLGRSGILVDTRGRPLQEIWQPRYCRQCGHRMSMFEIDGKTRPHCLRCQPDADFLPGAIREPPPDDEN